MLLLLTTGMEFDEKRENQTFVFLLGRRLVALGRHAAHQPDPGSQAEIVRQLHVTGKGSSINDVMVLGVEGVNDFVTMARVTDNLNPIVTT